jgi:hypothetical protein
VSATATSLRLRMHMRTFCAMVFWPPGLKFALRLAVYRGLGSCEKIEKSC